VKAKCLFRGRLSNGVVKSQETRGRRTSRGRSGIREREREGAGWLESIGHDGPKVQGYKERRLS